jgi:hypothetical protein
LLAARWRTVVARQRRAFLAQTRSRDSKKMKRIKEITFGIYYLLAYPLCLKELSCIALSAEAAPLSACDRASVRLAIRMMLRHLHRN